MKIQVGVGTREEFDRFLKAGADEFYCGYKAVPGHLYGGDSFAGPDEIAAAVKAAHNHGRKFFFAANEVQAHALKPTVAFIKEMAACGVDGIIVRDLAVLDLLGPAKHRMEYILSSLSPCYNESALAFYRARGITRLALPEHLLPSEAAGLVRNKWGIGTEVFLGAREYCVVFNGLCYLKQFDGECKCREEFRPEGGGGFVMPCPTDEEHFGALYDFNALGVQTLKMGRSPAKNYSAAVFGEVLAVNKLLEAGLPKKDFVRLALKHHRKINLFLRKWSKA